MQNSQTIRSARPARRRRSSTNPLLVGLLVAFLIAGSITAYLTFRVVRDIVASQNIFGMAGDPVSADNLPTPTPDPQATPGSAAPPVDMNTPLQPSGPTPQPWDGASRVTILVMGMDYGDWSDERSCPCRTDTMILFTVDPLTQSAGILNIPRDLWVDIPDYGYYKINMANYWGDYSQLPGGGPGLAIETVENFLGVPINFYALIDFASFERLIDEIGGIEITVTEELSVDPLGPHNTVTLAPGTHLLDGPTALAFARQRYTEGGDFDRADRQQQVILAIRNRVLSLNMLPDLIAKAPVLYNEVASGVSTNMTLEQAVSLAWTVAQIPEEKIKRGVISPPNQVLLGTSPDGSQAILLPVPDAIRLLRDEIFTPAGPVSPAAENGSLQDLMKAEAARVQVLNGSDVSGLAASTSEFLQSQGMNVVDPGNADRAYGGTTIIDYTGNPYTVKFLVELMAISEFNIYSSYDPNSAVDAVVILGQDWANSNPMP